MNASRPAPLTSALSSRRGAGSFCMRLLPTAAFVPHLPWDIIFLPPRGNQVARCAWTTVRNESEG